ncbi:MAG: diaminopimelate decarboxylase [Actinobacteria bacterium]|nr:diaminopimelate decarboxylase [Actinomycetota bacterium]
MPATDPLYTVRGGHLCFDDVDLVEMADGRATPFFVFSERRLRDNIEAVLGSFRRIHEATDVFYASKACSNLWFLGVVRDAGANVEVNAEGELEKALAAGFEPSQIVFNGVAKTRHEIEHAVACGVRALMVDSLYELGRVGEVAASIGAVAAVAPRIDVHVPTLTHPGLETAHGGKAGIDRDDAARAFVLAAEHPNLEPAGMHLHIGSQITSVEPYRQAIDAALDLVAEVEGAAGVRLRFLNAGGGFAVPYREAPVTCHPSDYFCSLLTAADYAQAVGGAVAARRPDLQLFLEPGRSIAATTAVLVSRIENEKVKGRRDGAGRRIGDERWVTVDAGFNTLLEHTNYAWYYRTIVASRAGEEADTDFRLAGPLCDGGDVYAGDADSPYRRFPAGTTVGDVVAFLDAGAYTLEMMNPYNARPTAAAYAVTAAGELVQIRRRDTVEDLVAHDVVPGDVVAGEA